MRGVNGRTRDDPGAGVLPRLVLAFAHSPQIDLRLHDEDALDIAPYDSKKRCVAFGERLLRVDEVEHGIGRRQIGERRAAMGRIDRSEPRRIGDDETVLQERRVDGNAHECRCAALVARRVMQFCFFADGNESREPTERNTFFASARIDRRRGLFGRIAEFGDRRGRGVDIGCKQPDDARTAGAFLKADLAE